VAGAVASLFPAAQVVLLGEPAPSAQVGRLVQALLPRLHAAGVDDVGIWWAQADDQDLLDRLVTSTSFDEAGACWAVQRQTVRTGADFAEYLDVVRAAWRCNRQRPAHSPALRLVGLDAELALDAVTDTADLTQPEAWFHLRPRGPLARLAADVVAEQVLARGRRALLVVPQAQAFTRWRRPFHPLVDRYDIDIRDGQVLGLGNRLFGMIGDRAVTVLVHGPAHGTAGGPAWADVADGRLDAALLASDVTTPCLLPLAGPVGELPLGGGWESVSLRAVAQHWLVAAQPGGMHPPTPVRGLVHDGNIDEQRRRALDPLLRRPQSTPQDFETRLTSRVHEAMARWRTAHLDPDQLGEL
jgi:hypothetical protein